MKTQFTIYPVGVIHKKDSNIHIEIFNEYKDAMTGLEQFSHIDVFYWFDQNDIPGKRNILKVHPRKNPNNPLTGIFATHSPVRPNLLGVTVCKILSMENTFISIEEIDAFDNSPVIDIKGHSPRSVLEGPIKTPFWAQPQKPIKNP